MRHNVRILVCLLLCLLILTVASGIHAQRAAARLTLFEGARLILGDGQAPIENSAFVVENGRFTSVGRKGEVQAPAGEVVGAA